MSSSPERALSTYVLKDSEDRVRPARMSAALVDSPFVRLGQCDPRLVDPLLQEVVERAENEARMRGFRAGYDAGYVNGREAGMSPLRALQERARERDELDRIAHGKVVDRLVEGVRAAVTQALADREPAIEERFDMITAMAVEIAESLVGHHLTVGSCAAADAVARALREVPRGGTVTLRMHPEDVATVARLREEVVDWDIVAIRPDSGVERFGCVAVAGDLEVDAQLGPALEHVKRVLNR